jgi:hypothetical protein
LIGLEVPRPRRPPTSCGVGATLTNKELEAPNSYADARVIRFTILLFFSKDVAGKSFQQSLDSLPFVALGNEAEIQR